MAAYEYGFTLTPGNSSRTRSLAISCAAIAAVCVLSSTLVIRELVGTPTARAAIAAPAATAPAAIAPVAIAHAATASAATAATPRAWVLQPRWWPGQIKQIVPPAAAAAAAATVPATVPDSELTFAKGYQLRLATRQATQQAAQPASLPAQIAAGPTAESQPARTATRKVNEVPNLRRVNAPQVDPFARFDTGSRALAYDEQRPRERGFVFRSAPSRGLFGTLY